TPRADSCWSKRKPTATRRSPPFRAHAPPSIRRLPMSTSSKVRSRKQPARLVNSRPRSPRPSAIYRSPSSAPLDGVIGNRAVQTGDYVQIGQRLASLVPLDEVYVNANFKETQLARLRPGQTASIAVDA